METVYKFTNGVDLGVVFSKINSLLIATVEKAKYRVDT